MRKTMKNRCMKLSALAMFAASGALFQWGCTLRDIQHNLISGSLGFVEGTATAFWETLILEGVFGQE